MKFERLPTRRKPVRKTLSARLFNKTKTKRQRAAAASASPDDMDESGINISRSLSIIFAIHIVAIGMIFVHKQYLSDRTPEPGTSLSGSVASASTPDSNRNNDLPKLSTGDTPYMVRQGDNYSIIAAKHNVDESELRNLNRGADIRAGAVLRIPKSKRIIAEDPPEVAAIRNQYGMNDSERGLVEIVPPVASNTARIVKPMRSADTADIPRASVVGSGRTHVLKAGENIWRISNKYNVSQKELMALNNITDPTKLKIGQVIKLP